MKKKRLLIGLMTVLLVVTLALGLVACDDDKTEEVVTITGVSVVGNPVYYIEDFSLSNLKLKLTYSNNTEEIFNFDEKLVPNSQKESLKFLDDKNNDGKETKTISFTYNEMPVEFTFSMEHNPSKELKDFGDKVDFPKVSPREFQEKSKPVEIFVEGFTEEENNIKTVKYRGNGQTNAGEYQVLAQISAPGYRTKEIYSKIVITPKRIEKPEILKHGVYRGAGKQNSIDAPLTAKKLLNDKTKEYVYINEKDYKLPNVCKISGDKSVNDANTIDNPYKVTISLKNKNNYVFWDVVTDETTTDDVVIDWFVDKQVVDLTGTKWEMNDYLYDGNEHMVYVNLTNPLFARILDIKYSYFDPNFVGDPAYKTEPNKQKNVGEYKIKVDFSVKKEYQNNYELAPNSTYENSCTWKIYHDRIPDRVEIDMDSVVKKDADGVYWYEYNGALQHPNIDMNSLNSILSDAKVTYSDDGRKNVNPKGEFYTIDVIISKDGLEPLKKQVKYKIIPKKISIPYIREHNKQLAYNGSEQRAIIEADNMSDIDKYVNIQGNIYGIEPNKHKIVMDLKDKTNLVWNDENNSINAKYEEWEILKIDLGNLNIEWIDKYGQSLTDKSELVYSYGIQEVKLNVGVNNGLKVEYTGNIGEDVLYDEKGNIIPYTASAKISLIYDGNEGINLEDIYDGLASFRVLEKEYSLNWYIVPKVIDCRDAKWTNNSFIYMADHTHMGATYKVSLDMPQGLGLVEGENKDYIIEGNTFEVKTGNFEEDKKQGVNKTAYVTTVNKNIKIVGISGISWEVIYNPITGVDCEEKIEKYYTGELYNPVELKGYAGKEAVVKYSPETSFKNVGTYEQTVEVTMPGYTCFMKTATLTIKPIEIDKPVLKQTEFVFNGKEQSCGITNLDIFDVTDDIKYLPNNEGETYKARVNIKKAINENGEEVYNYIWRGSNNPIPEEVVLDWTITKLDIPTISNEFDYVNPFEYDGKEHSIVLKEVPFGLVAKYQVFQNGVLLDKNPVNHGTYTTKVALKFEGKNNATIEQCYTKETVAKINALTEKEQVWEISKKTVNMRDVSWKIYDTKKDSIVTAAIYQKNYRGEETKYEMRLVNLPKEIVNLVSIVDNKGFAISTYKTVATLNDLEDNFILENNYIDFEIAPNNNKIFTIEWEIEKKDLDNVIIFETNQKPVRFGYDKVIPEGEITEPQEPVYEKKEFMPEYKIINEQIPGYPKTVDQMIKDGEIKIEFPGEGFNALPVSDVGEYVFLTRITVPGFAVSEKLVNLTVKPMRVTKPTLVPNAKKTITYTKADLYSVADQFKHTQENWENIYSMEKVTVSLMESPVAPYKEYEPYAALKSGNFIWAGDALDETNDKATNLKFTDSNGQPYKWSVVA